MPELEDKRQELFCREFLVDLHQANAAIRANYSQKYARNAGARLMTYPHVVARIQELIKDRNNRIQVDSDLVLSRHKEIDEMDLGDIMNDDLSLKPLSEWPKVWRQYLSGVHIAELFDGQGDERKIIGVLKKIRWPDKLKNLELMGKHVDVQAYKERKEVDHTMRVVISEEDAEL